MKPNSISININLIKEKVLAKNSHDFDEMGEKSNSTPAIVRDNVTIIIRETLTYPAVDRYQP